MSIIPIVPMNADISVSHRTFRSMYGDRYGQELLVYSIFETIQGEGPYAGTPALFIRLGGCNFGKKDLICQFCDSEFFFNRSKSYTLPDLYKVVDKYVKGRSDKETSLVVITGGEPLLQAEALKPFIRTITADHFGRLAVQIETNGIFLEEAETLRPYAMIVVSPKASPSKGYALYEKFVDNNEGPMLGYMDAVKFLISADPSSPYYDLPAWATKLTCRVYLSPIAEYLRAPNTALGEVASAWDSSMIDTSATQANYARAAQLCMKQENRHFRLSIQQHLFYNLP